MSGPSEPGRSPLLDAAQLDLLRQYGSERDVAAGDVLFADGDETYDLFVMLDGTAELIERTAGRVLPVPVGQLRVVMAQEPTSAS